MMKKRLGLFIFLFFFCFAIPVHAEDEDESENSAQEEKMDDEINLEGQIPRMEFKSTHFNFDKIYRGQFVRHQFEFENKGNGVLVLSGVHTPCGCMNTQILSDSGVPKGTFKPNEKGIVMVDFDSSPFTGRVERNLTMETNMPAPNSTEALTLSANIVDEIESSPQLIYVGHMDKDAVKRFTVDVKLRGRAQASNYKNIPLLETNWVRALDASKEAASLKQEILNNEGPLKILQLESNVPYIKANLEEHGISGKARITVTVGGKLPIGPLSALLTVWNNSTHQKQFQIPIVGEVEGHVSTSAKYVEFGVVSSGNRAEKVISFRSSDKRFEIKGVKIDLRRVPEMKDLKTSDLFEVRRDRSKPSPVGQDYLVGFKLRYPQNLTLSAENPASVPSLNVSGSFVVKTNDPDYKEIVVPFFGVLKKEL